MANHPTLEQLPSAFSLPLTQYSIIRITGDDQQKYLQGQVTCNVFEDNRPFLPGAQCDAKGKVVAFFHLLHWQQQQLLIQPNTTFEASLAQFKKYGVFANVTIEACDNLQLTVLAGKQIHQTLIEHNISVPEQGQFTELAEDAVLVQVAQHFPCYLLIASKAQTEQLLTTLNIPSLNSHVWSLLAIDIGLPYLATTNIAEFVPQMLNIQALGGISFTKGCYLGQETVARMQYLGKNKKAMITLSAQVDDISALTSLLNDKDETPSLELQLGDNWRKLGDILHYYLADDGQFFVQAVVANDLEPNAHIRLKQLTNILFNINELPYSLSNS